MAQNLDDSNFDATVSKGTVLVDFWAEWCGPCKSIAPAIDELEAELSGKVAVAKVNVDDAPAIAAKYGIRGVPTFMVFKDGDVIDTKVGAMPSSKLKEWVRGAA